MEFLIPDETAILPVLPLRDVVVYPRMVIPLFAGRPKSKQALEAAAQDGGRILLVAQKKVVDAEPELADLYTIGTLAHIVQLVQLPDGTLKALVEGEQRVRLDNPIQGNAYIAARFQTLDNEINLDEREREVLMRSANKAFEDYVKLNTRIPAETVKLLADMQDPAQLIDSIAAQVALKLPDKQQLLEILDVGKRLEQLLGYMQRENEILDMEKSLHGRVKGQLEKNQREYYLHEQMKAIQKEMRADGDEAGENELEALEKKIKRLRMNKEAKAKATRELEKLKMMSPMSSEATVVRNYLDVLLKVPWKKRSKVRTDINEAQIVLDKDHYGLEKVKERILEYLAVQQRVRKLKGPILCLVGPPGVGKTSLGESIARATQRKYVRMALGGVRDEAEIRGHRRTYVSALPGKIVQGLSKVGVKNPLFLLDEIDKMAMDARGDPASALLEVLDPEQNHTFQDHYLELDYDLSDVMFVATANSLDMPSALLDRMEVIRLSGYTEDEKISIAENYLFPKQLQNNGLKEAELQVETAAVQDIVRYYTLSLIHI